MSKLPPRKSSGISIRTPGRKIGSEDVKDDDRTYFRVTFPIHERSRELSTKHNGLPRKPAAREKNYVFVSGNVNAGKTTIIAGIAKSLWEKYLVFVYPGQRESNTILQQHWLQNLNENLFPPRSRKGVIYEIEIGVKNGKEQEAATNLDFFEASGEDLVELSIHAILYIHASQLTQLIQLKANGVLGRRRQIR